jgi:hypothetical protein
MIINYNKTYGIKEGYHKGIKKYFIVNDGKTLSLCYSNPIFAMKKSENFVRGLYKDFIDFKGNLIRFTFTKQDYTL